MTIHVLSSQYPFSTLGYIQNWYMSSVSTPLNSGPNFEYGSVFLFGHKPLEDFLRLTLKVAAPGAALVAPAPRVHASFIRMCFAALMSTMYPYRYIIDCSNQGWVLDRAVNCNYS